MTIPLKTLEKIVDVNASPLRVWEAWATSAGLRAFLCERSRIDLRPGGDLEILFDPTQSLGSQGSEGCVVVSYEKGRSLSFTWNFPPSLPTIRNQHTIVHLDFAELADGDRCRLTLAQTGFLSEGEWPAGYTYFDRAWGIVLEQLQKRFLS